MVGDATQGDVERMGRSYTLHSIIVDVLRNAHVRGEFSNESIAQQIVETCALCRVWISTREDRETERMERASAHSDRATVERLQYSIDLFENKGGRLLEVLGRERGLDAAHKAFEAYVAEGVAEPGKHHIALRLRSQVIRSTESRGG